MNIKSISVKGFRNLAEQTVCLGENLNIFSGNNAQGKTNLLESVYLCCLGKSPRTEKDKDMINYDKEHAWVTVDFSCRAGLKRVGMALSKSKKTPSVNDIPTARIGELLGHLNCVFFSPDEIRIVTQSPVERRRFLDIDLCQTDKSYYYSLIRFNRILNQRNNLLKKAENLHSILDILAVWDIQLAEEGSKIIYKRAEFCRMLAPLAKESHLTLTKTEHLDLSYLPSITGSTKEEIKQNYLEKLSQCYERDFSQRFTTCGCQRDDVKFSVDGIDMRSFGSQGQQRTTALSLKLAELNLFYKITGEYPVLLLDDVLSELDRNRQKALLGFNNDVQIILTATKVEASLLKGINYKKFTIKNGIVKE